jgi:hypothetical protein
MAQAIIAVDECRALSVVHDSDVWPRINCSVLDLFYILRQSKNAVCVAAARVRLDH